MDHEIFKERVDTEEKTQILREIKIDRDGNTKQYLGGVELEKGKFLPYEYKARVGKNFAEQYTK